MRSLIASWSVVASLAVLGCADPDQESVAASSSLETNYDDVEVGEAHSRLDFGPFKHAALKPFVVLRHDPDIPERYMLTYSATTQEGVLSLTIDFVDQNASCADDRAPRVFTVGLQTRETGILGVRSATAQLTLEGTHATIDFHNVVLRDQGGSAVDAPFDAQLAGDYKLECGTTVSAAPGAPVFIVPAPCSP